MIHDQGRSSAFVAASAVLHLQVADIDAGTPAPGAALPRAVSTTLFDPAAESLRELARHPRCWDSHVQIEDDAHVQRLVEVKRAARAHRACDRLAQAAPAAAVFLQRAGARGENLGSITATLMRLLQRWGAAALQAAIAEALVFNCVS